MIKKIYRKLISEKSRIELKFLSFKVRAIFYYGNKKYCNCCGKSFRTFLTHGNIPRKNAACPYCNSLERTRLLYFFLERETDIFQKNKYVLHFAPERMLEKRLSSISENYISADINPAYAKTVVDITKIPYQENTFNFIICSHVLGHVPDEAKAIDEMYRVLKPGGKAVVMTVLGKRQDVTCEDPEITSPEGRLEHYGESDLVRLHGNDFTERLKRKGIEVEKIDYRSTFSEEEIEKFSLGDNQRELIFYCKKQMGKE